MSDANDFQSHVPYKVRKLHHQAIDARTEGRHADQEAALKEAVELAGPLDASLSLRIKERYWLADAQRIQGKHKDALGQYDWLIGLISHDDNQKPPDNNDLYYLAGAYIYFVECGLKAPNYLFIEEELKTLQDQIFAKAIVIFQNKITEGLHWLQQIKKRNWSAGLYLQWGLLFKRQASQEEMEIARTECLKNAHEKLQTALDYAGESTGAPGYTFVTYQLELADLCCDIGLYAKAIDLAEKVLATADSNMNERERAYKILIYAQLEKGDMAAMHILPLKDQPLDTSIKSTETVENHILKQLRSMDRQLGYMSTAQYEVTSDPIRSGQRGPSQKVSVENPTNVATDQLGASHDEQSRNFNQSMIEQARVLSESVHEQAMSINKLLQGQTVVQASIGTTNQIPVLHNVPLTNSLGEKEELPKSCTEHIVCLVALPSSEKDDSFHKVLLPALRRVLELKPYYWQVVCEDERIYESIEQLNFLAWLNRAQAYIADITLGSFKVMIELGAMLSAKNPDQPLLVLKEEKCTQHFADMLGMVGLIFEYPQTQKGDEWDVKRVAEQLEKHFHNHEGISELNKGKKAHYLSSLFFMQGGDAGLNLNEDIARKLSREFTTMQEAVQKTGEDAFRRRAEATGLNSGSVNEVRSKIIACLGVTE